MMKSSHLHRDFARSEQIDNATKSNENFSADRSSIQSDTRTYGNKSDLTFKDAVDYVKQALDSTIKDYFIENSVDIPVTNKQEFPGVLNRNIDGTFVVTFLQSYCFDGVLDIKGWKCDSHPKVLVQSIQFPQINNSWDFKRFKIVLYKVDDKSYMGKISFTFCDSKICDFTKHRKNMAHLTKWIRNLGKAKPQAGGWLGIDTEGIDNIVKTFTELLPGISNSKERLDEFLDEASGVVDSNKELPKILKKAIDDLSPNNLKTMMAGTILSVSSVIFMLATAAHVIVSRDSNKWYWFGLGVLGIIVFNRERMGEILSNIMEYVTKGDQIVPQAGGVIGYSLGALCLGVLFYQKFDSKAIKEIMNTVGTFDKFQSGVVHIFSWISNLLCKALDYVGLEKYVPNKFKYMFVNNTEVKKFVEDVTKLHADLNDGSFKFNDTNYYIVEELIRRGKDIRLHSGDHIHSQILSTETNFLSKLLEKMASSNYKNDGRRPEPASLLLTGPPGNLKSQVMDFVIYGIAKRTFNKEELAAFDKDHRQTVYNCAAETGYWDGYKASHTFCVFDDFGQTTDIAGQPDNEYMKIIRAMGETSYMLHMADLNSKGSTFFGSKYVLCNTNEKEFKRIQSIKHASALYRRFHFVYHTVVKPEYRKEQTIENETTYTLDGTKLPVGKDGNTVFTPDCIEFWEYDLNLEKRTGNKISFEELVSKLVGRQKTNEIRFKTKSAELRKSLHDGVDPVEETLMLSLEDLLEDQPKSPKDSELEFVCEEYRCSEKAQRVMLAALQGEKEHVVENLIEMFQIRLNGYFSKEAIVDIFLDHGEGSLLKNLLVNYAAHVGDLDVFLCSLQPDVVNKYTPKYRAKKPFYTRIQELYVTTKDILVQSVGPFMAGLWDYRVHFLSVGCFLVGVGSFLWHKWYTKLVVPCSDPDCDLYRETKIDADGKEIVSLKYTMYPDHTCGLGKAIEVTDAMFPEGIPLQVPLEKLKAHLTVPQADYIMRQRKETNKKKIKFQAGDMDDPNGRGRITKILLGSVYKLVYHHEPADRIKELDIPISDFKTLGTVTFIQDNICLLPRHFVLMLGKEVDSDLSKCTPKSTIKLLYYTNKGVEERSVCTIGEFIARENRYEVGTMMFRDQMILRLPRHCAGKPHATILSAFPSEKAFKDIKSTHFKLYGFPDAGIAEFSGTARMLSEGIQVGNDDIATYKLEPPFEYTASTKAGDCGSLFVIYNKRKEPKIYGMHVAGKEAPWSMGYSTPIYREDLELAVKRIKEDSKVITDVTFQCGPVDNPGLVPSGMLLLETCATQVPKVTNTKIIESPLHGCWESLDVGASRLTRKAYELAIQKYDRAPIYIEPSLIRTLVTSTFDYISSRSIKSAVEKRLLTWDETVRGIEDEDHYGAISRTTSPGYPFVLDRGKTKGKEAWFGSEMDFMYTDKFTELLDQMRETEKSLARLERMSVVYCDNLKDERRPIEKVLNNKTRLFSGCPLDYLLLVRRYFGSFTLWIHKNRIQNGICVGINPYTEWHELAQCLLIQSHQDDDGFLAGDFSGFDCSEKSTINWEICHCINDWYGDSQENKNIRLMLWLELVNSRHIYGTLIYEWARSLPSGHPLTVIVNSIYNLVSFRYCWYRAMDNDLNSLDTFNTYVYVAVYGDDSNCSVHPNYRDVFNEFIVQKFMKELDLMYTSDSKDEFFKGTRKLKDISFLKRSYIYDDAGEVGLAWLGALDKNVIMTTPCWTKEDKYLEITQSEVEWCLKELSAWGKEEYEKRVNMIVDACFERIGWRPPIVSYYENRRRVLKEDGFY